MGLLTQLAERADEADRLLGEYKKLLVLVRRCRDGEERLGNVRIDMETLSWEIAPPQADAIGGCTLHPAQPVETNGEAADPEVAAVQEILDRRGRL